MYRGIILIVVGFVDFGFGDNCHMYCTIDFISFINPIKIIDCKILAYQYRTCELQGWATVSKPLINALGNIDSGATYKYDRQSRNGIRLTGPVSSLYMKYLSLYIEKQINRPTMTWRLSLESTISNIFVSIQHGCRGIVQY